MSDVHSDRLTVFDSQTEAYEQAFATFLAHTDQKRQARAWLDKFIDQLPRRSVFIDAGAGNGLVTQWFVDGFERAIAIEPNEFLREELAANCPQAVILPHFIHDAQPDTRGDLVLCSHVLYYIEQDQWMPTLEALAGFVAPGGGLAVCVQNSGTDCMRMLEHFHGRRFDLSQLGDQFSTAHGDRYSVAIETVPAAITAPDLTTAYAIAEFMLNLLHFDNPPLKRDVEQYVSDRFASPEGYRMSCSQDFLIIRPKI